MFIAFLWAFYCYLMSKKCGQQAKIKIFENIRSSYYLYTGIDPGSELGLDPGP